MASKAKSVDILNGPIVKGILAMAIPIMVMNVLQSLFGIIDIKIVAHLGGSVGAVSVGGTFTSVLTGLLIGLAVGANVVISKYIGQGDKEEADKTVGTAILISIVGGLAIMVLGLIVARPVLILINCPASLLDDATVYLRLFFISVPGLILYNFAANILRSIGETKKPMIFYTIAGVIKIVLTYALILLFKDSMWGVGVATILANLFAGITTFVAVLKNKKDIEFKAKHLKFYGPQVKQILGVGIPAGLQTALYSLANLVIGAEVNKNGEFATTGISIANHFDAIIYQIVVAPGHAVTSFVAQNVGANNFKRVKQIVIKATILTVLIGGISGGLSAIFSGQLTAMIDPTPEVIAYSRQKMTLVSSLYFICGIYEIFGATLRGLGKAIVPTICTLSFMCGLRFLWVYLIYPLMRGNLTFLYLVWPVGWVLSIAVMLAVYIPTIKKLEENAKQEKLKPNLEEQEVAVAE